MKIAIAGTGYVGLVTGVCLAEKGHQVTCVDVDEKKVAMLQNGKSPVYEEGLEQLMYSNATRLSYTTNYSVAYQEAEVVFIAVGTPEKKDGSVNLSYVYGVVGQIAASVQRDCIVVVKSTVPIGTNDKIQKILNENKTHNVRINVASNPEFLAQGTAVRDTFYANRIVIGVENPETEEVMRSVYKDYNVPILVMDRRSAEMVKYASNDFLALKISYINEIANLCEMVGANVQRVALGMGYDSRIGDKFLNAGIGYGGSCFPKDTKALHWLANMKDYEIKTIKAAIEVNEQQKLKLIKKARRYYESFEGLTIAVLGLTFKPGTDDLRDAPSLVNVPILVEEGAKVKAWDPVGIPNFKKLYPDITYCETIDEAINAADLCFVFTEWDQIKNFDVKRFVKLMRRALILDGRNCLNVSMTEVSKLEYVSIGR